jgi:hypothetical protein
MSKLAIAVVLVASTSTAFADIVEPTQEPDPAAEEAPKPDPRIVAPAMVAPTADDEPRTPPLTSGHLAGELLLGGLFAVGGTIGGGFVGFQLETSNGCHSEFCGLGGALLGGAVGLTFVTPVGVYLAGDTDGQTGSLGATIGGSVIGSVLGIAVAAGAGEDAAVVGGTLLIAGPVVGSMIGFNLTRKYDASHKRKRQWAPVASASSGSSSFGVVGTF